MIVRMTVMRSRKPDLNEAEGDPLHHRVAAGSGGRFRHRLTVQILSSPDIRTPPTAPSR
jgi:hypothetical protein